ncbi:MAG TPA: hypothetical protein VFB99_23890 [Vicinamibacterales bacterium]|nr:hypothetical protein [Vicinamibacterales bacterium]
MSVDDVIGKLAASLRDTILETSESYLKEDPKDTYVDLACRLVTRLSQDGLTVMPVPSSERRIQASQAEGAVRIFDILTRWLREQRNVACETSVDPDGKYQFVVRGGQKVLAFFRGESVQDAYAQAAQTIDFNGGSLDAD